MASKYIIIVGCGRLGGILANRLSAQEHDVVVIDNDDYAFTRLSADFSGFTIHGDATERETLHEAKISKADYLLAMTTQDNVNLMVAQIAKTIYNVPYVVARIYDPTREVIYREFGIETISPTHLTADAFFSYLKQTKAT